MQLIDGVPCRLENDPGGDDRLAGEEGRPSASYRGFSDRKCTDVGLVSREELIDEMREGVLVLDAEGRIIDANPAAIEMAGVAAHCLGRAAGEVFRGPWLAAVDALRAGVSEVTVGLDGRPPRVIEASASSVRGNGESARPATLVILRDVTERAYTAAAREPSVQLVRGHPGHDGEDGLGDPPVVGD